MPRLLSTAPSGGGGQIQTALNLWLDSTEIGWGEEREWERKEVNDTWWPLMSSDVRPQGFVGNIQDSNRKRVLEIYLRVRGQVLHKHSCCTKIIKHWVAYWFHSLYQCFHAAGGRTLLDRHVCHLYVNIYRAQEKRRGSEPRLSIHVTWVKMSFVFVCFPHLQRWFRRVLSSSSPTAQYIGINILILYVGIKIQRLCCVKYKSSLSDFRLYYP